MITENQIQIKVLPYTDMSQYSNILTPPSSNEDSSPQSLAYNSPMSSFSPSSSDTIYNMAPMSVSRTVENGPYLTIIEQPVDRFRFRYKSEMTGTHGSLCGQNSDRTRKLTYPSVELHNFKGRALIRCSIYQHNTSANHKPHAHRLIKKKGKEEVDDPHDVYVSAEDDYVVTFHNMGIIHTAKKNIESELIKKKMQLKREEIALKEGAYRDLNIKEEVEIKGLAASESKSINLNVVCLRFDAFVIYNNDGILRPVCPPVFSQSINNLKSALTGELKIVRMDHCTSPAKGNKEIFILVERVTKKNIKIRFYELDDDNCVVWEDYGRFSDLDVHHQYAIVFKTPPYKDLNIKKSVRVFIELERPSDKNTSDPKEFIYTPNSNAYHPGAKRARPNNDSFNSLSSEELPVTIQNLSIDNNACENLPVLSSAELETAMNNIDSDEFHKLFDMFHNSYEMDGFGQQKSKSKNLSSSKKFNSDILEAQYIVQELTKFMKTKPSEDKTVQILKYYLSTENKNNPLHVLIKAEDKTSVMLLLKMIYFYKQDDLINIRNENCETALHIAVTTKNIDFVTNLVVCKADVSLKNEDGNTPLHFAVMYDAPTPIFEKLFTGKNFDIEVENCDGNTALNLAIENENLRVVKLLCSNGANLNSVHKKQGFTNLRFAIEKENVDIVYYLLDHPDTNPLIEDFKRINALQAGLKRDNRDLIEIIQAYMSEHDIPDIEIKSEIEEFSEDDEVKVKSENISQEELREMYSNVTNFTPECLEEVSKILDETGSWENLADLLDLGYFLRSGLPSNMSSPAKLLLKMAVETNGDSILQIRDFLENLDELAAVEIIDYMVTAQYN